MILPAKHVPLDKSTLGVAAIVLRDLSEDSTVSEAWEASSASGLGSFDQFVAGLDLLFLLGILEHRDGRLVRS